MKVQGLRSQLGAIDAGGQVTSNDNTRLLKEKQILEDKVNDLESSLTSARQELDLRLQKYMAAFSHKCITLHIFLQVAASRDALSGICHTFRYGHCTH